MFKSTYFTFVSHGCNKEVTNFLLDFRWLQKWVLPIFVIDESMILKSCLKDKEVIIFYFCDWGNN